MNRIVFFSALLFACARIESTFVCKGMVRLHHKTDKPHKVILNWSGQAHSFPMYIYMQKPGADSLKPECFIADGVWTNPGEIYFYIPQDQLLRSKPLYIYFYIYTQDDIEYMPVGTLTLSPKSQDFFSFTPLN